MQALEAVGITQLWNVLQLVSLCLETQTRSMLKLPKQELLLQL
jgi:hypothetical protein